MGSNIKKIPKRLTRTVKNYCFILHKVWMVAPQYLVMLIGIALLGAVLPILPLFFMENVLNQLVNSSGEIMDLLAGGPSYHGRSGEFSWKFYQRTSYLLIQFCRGHCGKTY